jgi:hypothetical protein
LLIYPNPTNGLFQLFLPIETVNYVVTIYNSTGHKIYTSNYAKYIDLSKHCDGVYFIEVETNGENIKGKIIKKN